MHTLTRLIHRRMAVALMALAALVAFAQPAHAQITVSTTTLNAATTTASQGNNGFISVASTTGLVAGVEIFVDREAFRVASTPAATSGTVAVQRGYDSTMPAKHASGAIVYIGASTTTTTPGSGPFWYTDPPAGVCAVTDEIYNLHINVRNGRIWQCNATTWQNVVDAMVWIQPTSCWYSTGGGTFTTPAAVGNIGLYAAAYTGLTTGGATAPGTPVLQVATTNGGTATNTVSCNVPFPTRANPAKGAYLVDATWVYGVQQNALGTQAVTLASGFMNGIVAFGKITLPTAAASETASTVAQARWDTGTMVLTPVAASFNTATTTAGAFDTEKIAPATPIEITTDLTAYFVNFTWLCQATTATTVNIAGVLVHYRWFDDGL